MTASVSHLSDAQLRRIVAHSRAREDARMALAAARMPPDPWQASLLADPPRRALLVCSRQSGKSTTVAALCVRAALAGRSAVIVAPSQRQASELLRRAKVLLSALGVRPPQSAATSLTLANAARITALPGTETAVRGYTAELLVYEEAAFLPAATIEAAAPIIASIPDAQHVAVSTPNGRQGWFYRQWEHGGDAWHRVLVTADDCPRITEEFLATERASMPAARFDAEYYGVFSQVEGGFLAEDLASAFGGSDRSAAHPAVVGVDVGRARDHAALVVIAPDDDGVLAVRAVDRVELGTGYGDLAERCVRTLQDLWRHTRAWAAIDATGVGAPVVEMIRTRAFGSEDNIVGLTWTAGKSIGGAWPDVTVPKRALLDAVRTRLEQDRLRCPPQVPGADVLAADAAAYRPGSHVGDTLAAAAMAVWMCDHVAATARRLDHAA